MIAGRTSILLCLAATISLTSCGTDEREVGPPAPQIILEGYPTEIAESLAEHELELKAASSEVLNGLSSIVRSRQHRWAPNSTIKVAFYGGNKQIYENIERVAKRWTGPGKANITLSFKDSNGEYRLWTPTDISYSGDIRVGFNGGAYGSYWSLVGNDSIDNTIKGGAPNQQSMNFERFDKKLPADWEVTVLHEFGHAIGFEHEHQSPASECGFRFEDDAGYVKTVDAMGWYTLDKQDRRPGLYTYLGGYANHWKKPKVDHNLRRLAPSSAYEVGPYDRTSIMEYFFDPFMFKDGRKSPCYIARANAVLSPLDITAIQLAYPAENRAQNILEKEISDETSLLSDFEAASQRFKQSIKNRLDYQKENFK